MQLCETVGDWVYLEGCRLCGFFETEFEKITLGTRGVTNRYTTFCFMSCLFPYPECEMTLEFKGKRYTVGEVLEDNPQGWTCLELNICEVC